MTPTKDQQAQEYAEKQRLYAAVSGDGTSVLYTPKQFVNAYLDGYTACEQSMWRSVEEEEPEEDGEYLICTTDRALDTAFYEDGEWLVYGYTVAYWMNIPSLPDTNTEKI